jgi:hypothetical protein
VNSVLREDKAFAYRCRIPPVSRAADLPDRFGFRSRHLTHMEKQKKTKQCAMKHG